jgi:ADP-glucose pyrophosphorylase
MFYYEYNQDYQTVVQYKLINDQKIVLSSMQVPYEDFSKLELLLWLTSMDKVLELQQEN